jgi:hypothetical protein
MVLNPVLYDTLSVHFGRVRVSEENQPLVWEWDRTRDPPRPRIISAGEQYYCCCPMCGDTRYRLAVGHRWLTPLDRFHAPAVMTHNFRCYNEGCDIREHYTYPTIRDEIERNRGLVGIAVARVASTTPGGSAPGSQNAHRLPLGFTPLSELPDFHPACAFVRTKYGFDPGYLGRAYRVGYTAAHDPDYPEAHNRIIFPVFYGGVLLSWQARTVDPNNTKRWVFPPGFRKVLFNWDSLPRSSGDVIVIAEGIPAAIASGPASTAIFGKDLDSYRCGLIAQNFRTAIVATDPETQLPDPMTRRKIKGRLDPNDPGRVFARELIEKLVEAGMRTPPLLMPYPPEVMQIAEAAAAERRHFQDGLIPKPERWMRVPDPADIGLSRMQELIKTLPPSHWPRYLC